MIRAAARMAESELGRLALTGTLLGGGDRPGVGLGPGVVRVRGLGLPEEAVVEVDGRTHRLSRRHSEIVVALTENPRGLSAEQLETEVYPGRVTSSTLRAEMTRLRTLLGPEVMLSRPYRVQAETETDWSGVLAHLAAGRVRDALRAYKGPLLPGSEAPVVVELREGARGPGARRGARLGRGRPHGRVDPLALGRRPRDVGAPARRAAGGLPAAAPSPRPRSRASCATTPDPAPQTPPASTFRGHPEMSTGHGLGAGVSRTNRGAARCRARDAAWLQRRAAYGPPHPARAPHDRRRSSQ